MNELRSAADQSKALQAVLDAAQKKIADMTAQLKAQDDAAAIASQQAELKLQTALVEAERKASAKLESLREKIDALRDERDDLREQLRTLSAEREALLRMPGEDDAD